MKSKLFTLTTLAALMMIGTAFAQAQSWTQDVDWSAGNADAGGSVDCPQDYLSMNVGFAIASGGRSAVINEALFAAYGGDIGRAYQLVLLTQCHNPDAQQGLLDAGQNAVIEYLVRNYTPTGISLDAIQEGVKEVLTLLASSGG